MSWGGARPGGGRPAGWRKENPNPRKHRSLLAHEDEWTLIKKFADEVKHGDRQKCEELLQLIIDN